MIVRNPDQRIAVLVDVQNVYYSAKNLFNAKVNFKNLLTHVVYDRLLVRAVAYVIKSDPDLKEVMFFDALNNAGYEVKEKDLQTFYGGAKKGDWDLGIAMDAIRLGQKVDSIVLVSGDGDFKPVVNYLQQALGCLVEVVAFKRTANNGLIEMADDFTNIEEHHNLMFKAKPIYKKLPPKPSK
ncbi:NYN domain-containing protein [Patescibacteria group bacterium]|nr:NYN domain-containing protein [Patescibacteria group bacterium]